MRKRFFKDNRQIAYVLSGVVICLTAFFIIRAFINTNRTSAEEKTEAVASAVNALYFDNSYTFLKADIQQDEITELTKEVDSLRDGADKDIIVDRIHSVQQRFDLQSQLNGLFDKDKLGNNELVINGATIIEYVLVDDEVTVDKLDLLRDNYASQLNLEDDGFYSTAVTLIDEAEYQVDIIEEYKSDLLAIEEDSALTYISLVNKLTKITERVNEIENPYLQDKLLEMIATSDEEATQNIFNRLIEEAEATNKSDEALAQMRKEGQAAIKDSKSRIADLEAKREEILASNGASATITLRQTADQPSFGVNTNVTAGVLASKQSEQSTSRSSSRGNASSSSSRGSVSSSSRVVASSSDTSSSISSSDAESTPSSDSSTHDSSSEDISSSASSSPSDVSSASSSSSSVASSSDSSSASTSSSSDSASTAPSSDSSSSSASESSSDDSDIEDGTASDSSQMDESSSSSSNGSVIEDSATSSDSQEQSAVESDTTERPRSSVASDSVTESSPIPYGSPE
ncbi:cell division site-positioning protein MapZ family protein [Aerococcus urinaeequi]|uniref:Cell division site-positioning protein MapZ family protein n=1 Tax=Aerococcus urinaeequi TaxID=51665 RepID=A0AAF0BJG0_9LACT|nr:cell division site-positioning protein MapZ family protein [Aerococcus urinaeequi]WCG37620.1 cell division site-positioning protein MapZ family protein [Aerococcus urinaeequi]